MERPVYQPIGTPVERLDTPALVVDLATMEQNIEALHSFFRSGPARLRPHVTPHKCPTIAHLQLAAGGTVGGISVSRVGEAEVFTSAGFSDILVASEIVTRPKILRLCSLAHRSRTTVAVDNPRNLRDLSEAAQSSGVTLHVLVDINVGMDHCGVEAGRPALDLAKEATRSQGLRFAGLMAQLSQPSTIEGEWDAGKAIQPVLDTRELIERAGLEVETVSVGVTNDYEIVGAMKGVTEVRVGSYPLMDYSHCQYVGTRHASPPRPSARVLATVVSHPTAASAIVDAGHKAIGPDLGLPVLEGIAGARVTRLSAEHGILELQGDAQHLFDVGARVWLIPWDLGLCVNQYNYFHAIRDGKLEAVWEIAARGRTD